MLPALALGVEDVVSSYFASLNTLAAAFLTFAFVNGPLLLDILFDFTDVAPAFSRFAARCQIPGQALNFFIQFCAAGALRNSAEAGVCFPDATQIRAFGLPDSVALVALGSFEAIQLALAGLDCAIVFAFKTAFRYLFFGGFVFLQLKLDFGFYLSDTLEDGGVPDFVLGTDAFLRPDGFRALLEAPVLLSVEFVLFSRGSANSHASIVGFLPLSVECLTLFLSVDANALETRHTHGLRCSVIDHLRFFLFGSLIRILFFSQ